MKANKIKSAVDLWISLLYFITVSILAGSLFFVPVKSFLPAALADALIIAFLLWIYFDTYYEFHDKYLSCISGPLRYKIYYNKIKSAV